MYQRPGTTGMINNNGYFGGVPSPDSHTRVSYHRKSGYLERVGGSFCGSLFGIGVVFAAVMLLFYNEGRAVQTAQSLDEGLSLCISVGGGSVVDFSLEGKLVHINNALRTNDVLSDETYGVSVQAVKLSREVEMYQWVEHRHTREYDEGGVTRKETTYTYSMEWKSHVISSGTFDNPSMHHNPGSMAVQSKTFEAAVVNVGAFKLSAGLISRLSDWRVLNPMYPARDPSVKKLDNRFYHGNDPYRPQVGDLRIQFKYVGLSGDPHPQLGGPDRVSIIARQSSSQLVAYQTRAGNELEMLYNGDKTKEEIFAAEHSFNNALTWGLRAAGWFIMFIGLSLITGIITAIVSFVPILRDLVGLAVTVINLCLATTLSLTVIALGWIRYRPLLGCALLAAALAPILISKFQNKKPMTR